MKYHINTTIKCFIENKVEAEGREHSDRSNSEHTGKHSQNTQPTFLFNLHVLWPLRIAIKHAVSAPKSKPLKFLSFYLFRRTSSDQLFAADLYSKSLPGSSAAVRRCVELHMVLMSGGTHSPLFSESSTLCTPTHWHLQTNAHTNTYANPDHVQHDVRKKHTQANKHAHGHKHVSLNKPFP